MELVDLTNMEPCGVATGIRELYKAAYETPVYPCTEEEMDAVEGRIARHAEFSGFRFLGACVDEMIVGFTYGYTFPEGSWWQGSLNDKPQEVVGESLFGVIELAVSEDHRRKGYARIMHDALLRTSSENYATLLSRPGSVAHSIYPRWGWAAAGKVRSFPEWPVDDVFIRPIPLPRGKVNEVRELTTPPRYAQK